MSADASTGLVALELDHALGFTPRLQGMAVLPKNPTSNPDGRTAIIAYGCSQLLIIADLTNLHSQRLLRGHDADLTCVDISPTGKKIVTGQKASLDRSVSFIIWDFDSGIPTQRVITPHSEHVDVVKYSPDEGMIASTGADGSLCIWDAVTGSKVASFQDTVSGDRAKSLCWGSVENSGTRNQKYTLFVAFHTGVRIFSLQFSVKTLSFEMTCTPCQMPGAGGRMGGFVRRYTSCAQTPSGELLCGSSSGDVIVFSTANAAYRTSLSNLSSNGVSSVCVAAAYGCVLVGGGDGILCKIAPEGGGQWRLIQKTQVDGPIACMMMSTDDGQNECFVMTISGVIYRVLVADFSLTVASVSPLGGLTDVCVPPTSDSKGALVGATDRMASASKDGVIRLWDLSEYAVVCQFALPSSAACASGSLSSAPVQSNTGASSNITAALNPNIVIPTAIAFDPYAAGEGTRKNAVVLVSGWSDGKIRGIDLSSERFAAVASSSSASSAAGRTPPQQQGGPSVKAGEGVLLWTIPNGHKGIINSIRVSRLYYLTSGDESILRVWSRGTKTLTAQCQDHKLSLVSCLVDNACEVIVHSIAADMMLCSYDLTTVDKNPNVKGVQKIATKNFANAGVFTCATQRRDNEHEVIVGTQEGNVLFFDIDAAQPTMMITDKKRCRVTAMEVSPNGRWLVEGLSDGSLAIYELFHGEGQRCALVLQAACHGSAVSRCVWTTDGRQIISAGNDGELIVWNFFDSSDNGGM